MGFGYEGNKYCWLYAATYHDSPVDSSNLFTPISTMFGMGIEGAAEAWTVFEGRTVKPDYSDYPNWAVVPRVELPVE